MTASLQSALRIATKWPLPRFRSCLGITTRAAAAPGDLPRLRRLGFNRRLLPIRSAASAFVKLCLEEKGAFKGALLPGSPSVSCWNSPL